jgi:hypothetical protein
MSREIPRPEDLIGIYTGATPRCHNYYEFLVGTLRGEEVQTHKDVTDATHYRTLCAAATTSTVEGSLQQQQGFLK